MNLCKLFFLIIISSYVSATTNTKASLSEQGVKKLIEFTKQTDENITNVLKNKEICNKNIETINKEQLHLAEIEKEHQILQDKLKSQLETLKKALEDNDSELAKLQDNKNNTPNADPKELEERIAWKKETQSKLSEINESANRVQLNFKIVTSKKNGLGIEKQNWTTKLQNYEKIAKELNQKKKELSELQTDKNASNK